MQGAVLSRSSCQGSADEVIGSSSHEKRGVSASLLGFPSAGFPPEWERTVLSPLLFISCSWGEGPMQDLAAGAVRNEGRRGVLLCWCISKASTAGFGGLGETAVHRDLPKILGLALEVKQQGVHNRTLKRQGKRAGEQRKKDEKFFFEWTFLFLDKVCPPPAKLSRGKA